MTENISAPSLPVALAPAKGSFIGIPYPTLIHIVLELLVFGVGAFFIYKKITSLKNENQELKDTIEKLENKLKEHESKFVEVENKLESIKNFCLAMEKKLKEVIEIQSQPPPATQFKRINDPMELLNNPQFIKNVDMNALLNNNPNFIRKVSPTELLNNKEFMKGMNPADILNMANKMQNNSVSNNSVSNNSVSNNSNSKIVIEEEFTNDLDKELEQELKDLKEES